jgi:DNA-binding Xre family transcriptional regulator
MTNHQSKKYKAIMKTRNNLVRLFAKAYKQWELAAIFNISETMISLIINGKNKANWRIK